MSLNKFIPCTNFYGVSKSKIPSYECPTLISPIVHKLKTNLCHLSDSDMLTAIL